MRRVESEITNLESLADRVNEIVDWINRYEEKHFPGKDGCCGDVKQE